MKTIPLAVFELFTDLKQYIETVQLSDESGFIEELSESQFKQLQSLTIYQLHYLVTRLEKEISFHSN